MVDEAAEGTEAETEEEHRRMWSVRQVRLEIPHSPGEDGAHVSQKNGIHARPS